MDKLEGARKNIAYMVPDENGGDTMSREILFRGKRQYTSEWAESVCPLGVMHSGHLCDDFIPSTVGQYTGLKDKNGQRIFEGDVIECHTGRVVTVKFGQHMDEEYGTEAYGWFVSDNDGSLSFGEDWSGHEVIGNIHDNPELLKEEE